LGLGLSREGIAKELVDVILSLFDPFVRKDDERVNAIGSIVYGELNTGKKANAFLACPFTQGLEFIDVEICYGS